MKALMKARNTLSVAFPERHVPAWPVKVRSLHRGTLRTQALMSSVQAGSSLGTSTQVESQASEVSGDARAGAQGTALEGGKVPRVPNALVAARSLFAALNSRDVSAILTLLEEDVLYDNFGCSTPLRGRAAVGRFYLEALATLPEDAVFVLEGPGCPSGTADPCVTEAEGPDGPVLQAGVSWHLEVNGVVVPLSRGVGAYWAHARTGRLIRIVDNPEHTVKQAAPALSNAAWAAPLLLGLGPLVMPAAQGVTRFLNTLTPGGSNDSAPGTAAAGDGGNSPGGASAVGLAAGMLSSLSGMLPFQPTTPLAPAAGAARSGDAGSGATGSGGRAVYRDHTRLTITNASSSTSRTNGGISSSSSNGGLSAAAAKAVAGTVVAAAVRTSSGHGNGHGHLDGAVSEVGASLKAGLETSRDAAERTSISSTSSSGTGGNSSTTIITATTALASAAGTSALAVQTSSTVNASPQASPPLGAVLAPAAVKAFAASPNFSASSSSTVDVTLKSAYQSSPPPATAAASPEAASAGRRTAIGAAAVPGGAGSSSSSASRVSSRAPQPLSGSRTQASTTEVPATSEQPSAPRAQVIPVASSFASIDDDGSPGGSSSAAGSGIAPAAARAARVSAGDTTNSFVSLEGAEEEAGAGGGALPFIASSSFSVNLSGLWEKDAAASQSQEYESMLDVLELGGLQKVTARLIDGLDVRQDEERFEIGFVTVVPFFRVTEKSRFGSPSSMMRRDLRSGRQTAQACHISGGVQVDMSWEAPLAGSLREEYVSSDDGQTMAVTSTLRVGQRAATATQVYRRSSRNKSEFLASQRSSYGSLEEVLKSQEKKYGKIKY